MQATVGLQSHEYQAGDIFNELVGEVKNNGTQPADSVKITASFYDGNGNIVGTDFTFTEPLTIAPGDTGTFKMLPGEMEVNNATTYSLRITNGDESYLVVDKHPLD